MKSKYSFFENHIAFSAKLCFANMERVKLKFNLFNIVVS